MGFLVGSFLPGGRSVVKWTESAHVCHCVEEGSTRKLTRICYEEEEEGDGWMISQGQAQGSISVAYIP